MRRPLGALTLATALVAGCGSQPATLAPSAMAVASAPTPALTGTPPSPATTAPTPSSPTPAIVDEGMPVLVVPSAAIRMAPIPDSPGVQAGAAPTGPYAYLQGFGSGLLGSRTLYVADAGGGSERAVPLPLAADEQIDEVQTDGAWIVVAVSGPAKPGASQSGLTCRQQESQPRAWRILAAPLGADGLPSDSFRKIDAGVASRAFEVPGAQGLDCPYPATPPVALAAPEVAYAVEASGAASTVVVRPLPTGTFGLTWARTYSSPSQVYQVALSATAVAWSETANGLTHGHAPDWRVMTASITTGSPRQVPLGVVAGPAHVFPPSLLLDGTAVVASLDQFSGVSGTVVRVNGDTVETVDPGHANRQCEAVGADGGLVLLDCNGTTMIGDTATAIPSWVAVWSAGSGLRALGGGPAVAVGIANGWAVGTGVDANQHAVLVGAPLSALR